MHPSLFRAFVACCLVNGIACSGDTNAPVAIDGRYAFWRLTLNHHAVTLATAANYTTVQLQVIASTSLGMPLDGGTVRYEVKDGDTSIVVSATGLVTAIAPTSNRPVTVVASETLNGVTLRDSVMIAVNAIANPPHPATFSIQLPPGDSARLDYNTDFGNFPATFTLTPQLADTQGNLIGPVLIYYTSSDSTILQVDPYSGVISTTLSVAPGRVIVYATTTVYGVTKVDSLPFVVNAPSTMLVQPELLTGRVIPTLQFAPNKTTVAVGGIVAWANFTELPFDIAFDDPSAAQAVDTTVLFLGFIPVAPSEASGNIAVATPVTDTADVNNLTPAYIASIFRIRRFPRAGTFTYHSKLYGTQGKILVLDPIP